MMLIINANRFVGSGEGQSFAVKRLYLKMWDELIFITVALSFLVVLSFVVK